MMHFAKLINLYPANFSRFLGIFLLILFFQAGSAHELPMVIVIPSYNNEKWYEKNLHSVLNQHYSNYRILYVNDNSKDGTGFLIEKYLKELNVDYRVCDFDTKAKDINDRMFDFNSQVNQ